MRAGILLSICLWSLIVWALSGCSVHLEVGYHGETGRDDRTYTTDAKAKAKY